MSPLVYSPAIDNSKPIIPGMQLYRGISDKIEGMTTIGPVKPLEVNLNSPSEIVKLIFTNKRRKNIFWR